MQTQTYFEDIQKHILQEIDQTKSSIQIAVAWFTDEKLFSALCSKAKAGIAVELMMMNDDINNTSGLEYESLTNAGGKVWKISKTSGHDRLMHNKFCILDNNTVINGSYNWTRKAKKNHESITIISDNIELALQFSDEFRAIKENYFGKDAESIVVDFALICTRLSTIREAIRTGDSEDIAYLATKFKKHINLFNDNNLSKVYEILEHIDKRHYVEAVTEITTFVARFQTLTVYIDTEIAALRLEQRALELQISSLEDEKVELEKLIHEFEIIHNRELGAIILKILKLRKDRFKEESEQNPEKEKDYQDAEQDYKNYHHNFDALKEKIIAEISDEQEEELKSIYRRASKLCHPDTVEEKYKMAAEEIFKDLNNAYNRNDIIQVKEILSDLEKGIFKPGSETALEKKELLLKVTLLRNLYEKLEKEVQNIKQNETYQQIIAIEDWGEYFESTKTTLLSELEKLKSLEYDAN